MKKTNRLILWDQLSRNISSLEGADPKKDRIVFLETVEETERVKHHVKKLAFLFSSMRHFALELEEEGFEVAYLKIGEQEKSLTSGMARFPAEKTIVTWPGEYRVLQEVKRWAEIRPDSRFFCSIDEFADFARGKKKLLMEQFYRMMRKKTGLLMQDGEPIGGEWNYDKENRNPLKEKRKFPSPFHQKPDAITEEALSDVAAYFPSHFGELKPFWFAVDRKGAKKALAHFLKEALPQFGTYQDAMVEQEEFLYHSVLSHYLNAGLLNPEEVCEAVDQASRKGEVSIANGEGFIRQILGWREFVRGVYFLKMPGYAKLNELKAERKLPSFYWTGKTDMNCLKQVVEITQKEAYSHHIQRLMITGNFALLIGVLPSEVADWYLAVYADAHEWVELPNTLGMSQFGDGGYLASKPYAASGAYIDKMSNFCKTCHYKVKEKSGEQACPFNYLYWDFLMRHQKEFSDHPRMAMAYRTLDRFSDQKKKEIKKDAKRFLEKLVANDPGSY
jgi:deoxyribodipyrimidine photolyase-related protein